MNFNDFLKISCQQIGPKKCLSILEHNEDTLETKFTSITGENFYSLVLEASSRMDFLNAKNKRIAFWSKNNIELFTHHCASLLNNNQVCIFDNQLNEHGMNSLLEDFRPHFLFVDKSKWSSAQKLHSILSHHINLICLEDFIKLPLELAEAVNQHKLEDLKQTNQSEIVAYTSGTSGKPKGVVLGLQSVLFEVQSLKKYTIGSYAKRNFFSILPVNHMYGLTVFIGSLWADQEFILTQSIAPVHIRKIIDETRPNVIYVVPQFLNLIKSTVSREINKRPKHIQKIISLLLFLNSKIKSQIVANIFFGPIKNKIGSSIDFFISGGAPISNETTDFFEAIGIPVCNGYGLTETAPVITSSNLEFRRRGSVGKAIPGVEVRIDSETREIQTRGENIFKTYFNQPDLTNEVFTDDGWFKTGDLGYLDNDNYLFINGRSKNLIVLPNGKKIQPEEVEAHFLKLNSIKQCCLIYGGNKHKKLVLVISSSPEFEINNSLLIEHAKTLNPSMRPQAYKISSTTLPLTSTMKIKRFIIQDEIDNEN